MAFKNRVVVLVLCVIMSFFAVRHGTVMGVSAIETVSSCLLYPFLRMQQLIFEPITLWFGRRATVQELEYKVACLQKNYDELFAENTMLKSTHNYAATTDDLRDFNTRYLLKKGKIVHVLARHLSANNQFFLVDAGSQQGIKKDMVAVYNNSLVGRVAEVYPWYCKICLITDSECKVAAFCHKTKISGIHEGANSSEYTVLQHISHLNIVHVGSVLLSSGEGLVFPYGFSVGKIISADRGELFYDIKVEPVLNFQELRYCILVTKEDIGNKQ